jgi:hypothetical protein
MRLSLALLISWPVCLSPVAPSASLSSVVTVDSTTRRILDDMGQGDGPHATEGEQHQYELARIARELKEATATDGREKSGQVLRGKA